MQQTESCVNRMLGEISPSRVHTGCSLHSRRHWGGCILPAVCSACPGTAGRGNIAAREPKAPSCILGAGVQGLWAQSQPERGNRARHGIREAREKGFFPGCSHDPAVKLQNSKPGWHGAASGSYEKAPWEPRRS